MNEDRRATSLRRFDDGWRPFWDRVNALDADALRAFPDRSAWPVGLILAHCARWEEWNHDTIRQRVRDRATPSMDDLEQWNERWALEDRDVTPEDARRRLEEAHERLRSLIVSLRPEQWDELIARCVETCTYDHYAEHIESLPVYRHR